MAQVTDLTLQSILDPIVEEFSTGEYYPEVFKAKQEYFEKTGQVYEEDPEFEHRMCLFMDWYIFDRDLPGVDLPPIKFFYRKNKAAFTSEQDEIFKNLCNTIHSIFRMKGFSWFGKSIHVQDLFSNKTYKVNDPTLKLGLNRGDIFETRLIPFEGSYQFSKGFCFHPVEMEGFILNEVKKVRFQDKTRHTKLILQLSAMKLKHLRFQHIDVKHVYTFDSKF